MPARRPPHPPSTLLLLAVMSVGCGDEALDGQPSVDDAPSPDDARPVDTRTDHGADATPDAFELPMADATLVPWPDGGPDRGGGADGVAPADRGSEPEPALDAAPPMGPEAPPPYPADRTHSPITPLVAERLRAIADAVPRTPDVFAKVGDSVTVSRRFLNCVPSADLDLDGRDHLWPTVDHFLYGDAAGADPFSRLSAAATVGWSADHPLRGVPSPLDVELDQLDPRFAVVMFGTNDIERRDLDRYATELWGLTDRLIAEGVIPLMSTIMPRDDDAAADAVVPRYNAVVRAIARGRAVPLMDLHRVLLPLPDHGLGPDRLHPSTASSGACDLTPSGLTAGYNLRNLLVLTALDRARRALVEPAPDPPHRDDGATGGFDDPIVIDRLPFTDLRDTGTSPHRAIDAYPGCEADQDESGPEVVYVLRLERPTIIRARVFDRGDTDVDLHLLAAPEIGQCLDRNHRTIEASLAAGTWYFVLDTYVDARGERAGEYLFTVIED